MRRQMGWLGIAILGLPMGCAQTWEKVSSNEFKKAPLETMFKSEDPLHTLRTSPEGGKRAQAMLNLQEPLQNGGTQAEQDEVVAQILGPAATSDPFPVVRAAAIDTLARFQDPRCADLLKAAYHQASGRPAEVVPNTAPALPDNPVQPASAGRAPTRGIDPTLKPRFGLAGPVGFPDEVVTMLRGKALHGIAQRNTPDALEFVQAAATQAKPTEPADSEVRLAAVRALANSKSPAAVPALETVLAKEQGQNIALASRAREGIQNVTGKEVESGIPEGPITATTAPTVTAGPAMEPVLPNGVVRAGAVKPAGSRN